MRFPSHLLCCFLAFISIFTPSFCSPKPVPSLKENFEQDTKGSYDDKAVALSSGAWLFRDALIGSTDEDHKGGNQAVRIRKRGKVTMQFDFAAGAGAISVRHATYGEDESSAWELWYSTNKGKSWQQTGKRITSDSPTLQKAFFFVNVNSPVRLEIRKVTGEKTRLNFDDLILEPYGSGSNTSQPEASTTPVPKPTTPTPAPKNSPKSTVDPTALYLGLGNPSKADTKNPENYLMVKPQYALSYNRTKAIPNWVSWYVGPKWLGTIDRQNDFRPDKDLPAGWAKVTPTDYVGSGFDRGHVCPSADRQNNEENNSATFLMTNMVPQAPDNNQGPWQKLEAYCRRLVEKDIELYIVAGNYGTGGTGSNGFRRDLKGKVAVPAHTWKVVVVLPEGENDLSRINVNTRVIAVDIPNVQGIKEDHWSKYVTSVDAIEKATGYDLLSNVPKAIQEAIESKVSK